MCPQSGPIAPFIGAEALFGASASIYGGFFQKQKSTKVYWIFALGK